MQGEFISLLSCSDPGHCLLVCICRDDEILIRERVIHRNVGVSSCQADVGAQGYVVLASVPNHLSKYKWIVST